MVDTNIITLGIAVITVLASVGLSRLETKRELKLWEMKRRERYTEKIIDKMFEAYEELLPLINNLFRRLDELHEFNIKISKSKHTKNEKIIRIPLLNIKSERDKKIYQNKLSTMIKILENFTDSYTKYSYVLGPNVASVIPQVIDYFNFIVSGKEGYSASKSVDLWENVRLAMREELKIDELQSIFLH